MVYVFIWAIELGKITKRIHWIHSVGAMDTLVDPIQNFVDFYWDLSDPVDSIGSNKMDPLEW